MSFISAARDFLNDQGELYEDKNIEIMAETVSYLLDNAIGLENAKATDTIIEYLNENGYDINRHQWEIQILGKLREEGIFIASHKTKGMYIIKSKEEAEKFYLMYSNRIAKEQFRLGWLRTLIDYARWEE